MSQSPFAQRIASVPGYDWDVFISYASVDNVKTAAPDGRGWIDVFTDYLVDLLARRLQNSSYGRVWQDRQLSTESQFTTQLEGTIRSSAVFIVLMSDAYLTSEWCKREREIFVEAARATGGHFDRVFVVQTTSVGYQRWPATFAQRKSIDLFEQISTQQRARTLGWPRPNDTDRLYFQRIDDLCSTIAGRLEQMKRDTTPVVEPSGNQRPAVLLAQVSPDLTERREQLARALPHYNLTVVPDTLSAPDAFEEQLRADLKRCSLFVQLLGAGVAQASGEHAVSAATQRRIAEKAGVRTLFWRDPTLDLQAMGPNGLIAAPDVIAIPFTELAQEIVHRVSASTHAHALARAKERADAVVLVSAESWYEGQRATEISNKLDQLGIGYWVLEPDDSLADLAADDSLSANGFLIVSESSGEWLNQQMRQIRRLLLRRDTRGARGVRTDPAWRLQFRDPRTVYFAGIADPQFQTFVNALRTS